MNESEHQIIELSLECHKLVNMDFLSKTDTFVRVLTKDIERGTVEFISRTEIIWDNLNPRFTKKILLNYSFAEMLNVILEIYDADEDKMDGNEPKLVQENQVGKVEIKMSDIIRNMGRKMKSEIKHDSLHNRGFLVIYAEQNSSSKDIVYFNLKFKNLHRADTGILDFFANLMSSNFAPILCISKQIEDGTYINVYTSDEIRDQKLSINIKKQILCGCDDQRNLKFKIFDRKNDGDLIKHQELVTTLSILKESSSILFNGSECKIKIEKLVEKEVSNQIDFLNAGMLVNLIISIDFTASNQNQIQPESLHQLNKNPHILNQQEKCISQIAPILLQWDSDKIVPVQGFGAKINGFTNHCFPMFNGEGVQETQGVMATQKQWLESGALIFSGPTNFAPTLKMLNETAANAGPLDQFILLIMTDGMICDMEATIAEIVVSSRLPISIVIAGVGKSDFGNMDILDSDDERLYCKKTNKHQARDNVQFVPFQEYMNDFDKLKKEVLMELPDQIEEQQAYKKVKAQTFRKLSLSAAGSISIPGVQNM